MLMMLLMLMTLRLATRKRVVDSVLVKWIRARMAGLARPARPARPSPTTHSPAKVCGCLRLKGSRRFLLAEAP